MLYCIYCIVFYGLSYINCIALYCMAVIKRRRVLYNTWGLTCVATLALILISIYYLHSIVLNEIFKVGEIDRQKMPTYFENLSPVDQVSNFFLLLLKFVSVFDRFLIIIY